MTKWIEALIGRKTFTLWILVFALIIFSIFSWIKIPIEVMPREQVPPFLFLRIQNKEIANPDKIESSLAKPVENIFKTIPKIIKTGLSVDRSGVSVSLSFEPGTNLENSILLIQEALQELESKNVLSSKDVTYSKINPDSLPVFKLAIETGGRDSKQIGIEIEALQNQLEAWSEISKVDISGLETETYRTQLTVEKLNAVGLAPSQLAANLQNQEIRENLGEFQYRDSNTLIPVTAVKRHDSLHELLHRPLMASRSISLSDLSEIKRYEKNKEEWSHKSGLPAVFVEIYAKDSADLFALNTKISKLVQDINSRGFKSDLVLNRVLEIEDSLNDVLSSLYQALIITCLIVFLFYRDWRRTTLISISIPLSLLLTVALMYLHGQSLNILSLSGLILGLGMVVDNAILVIDRSDELYENMGQKLSAAKAAGDVFLPLLLSTLTNAVIFLPVAFVDAGDSFTDLLKALQVPILAGLLASMIAALIFVPASLLLWAPPKNLIVKKSKPAGLLFLENFFRSLDFHKYKILLLTTVVTFFVFKLISGLDQTDLGTAPDPYVQMLVRFAPEVTKIQRKSYFADIDTKVLKNRSDIGFKFVVSEFNPDSSSGTWTFYLEKKNDLEQEIRDLGDRVQLFMTKQKVLSGSHLSLGWDSWGGGKSKKQSYYEISGKESPVLLEIIEQLKTKIIKIAGVEQVFSEQELRGQRQLDFSPQSRRFIEKNISVQAASGQFAALLNPIQVNFPDLKVLQVSIRPTNQMKWSLSDLLGVTFQATPAISLSGHDLGSSKTSMINRSIARAEGETKQKIFAFLSESLSSEDESRVKSEISKIIKTFNFPVGYGIPISDSEKRIEEMRQKTNFVLFLSAFLIYLILASLFESILVPMGMMLAVPLSLIFGAFGLWMFSYDLDVMARLAMVFLVGTGVNSAIIIIDLIRQYKKDGLPQKEAIVRGCTQRFKAVLLSASIQIVSIFPVALGQSKLMGIPYSSLGIVIIFGTAFSTALTLIILPLTYQILDSLESLRS